jgi:hypothetical protein
MAQGATRATVRPVSSQSDVQRARKLASAYSSKLLQTFSHSLGQEQTHETGDCTPFDEIIYPEIDNHAQAGAYRKYASKRQDKIPHDE